MDTMDRVSLFSVLLVLLLAVFQNGVSADPNPGGNLIAIIASGDITDFGYSNSVNQGRIKMERTLNISGSYFASNIEDQDSCLALMKELAAKGYKLIISTTTAHVNAPIIAAGLYPNISFVMSGGTSTLPNLSSLNWSGPDQYYAAGVFAGANSKTNRVGFIHPGVPTASIGTLNAFYVGVKNINPNCEVYTVFTDSFLNPDRTTGASKILLAKGIDMLVGQQDDLTHQVIAMNAGFLAVGTSGFSLRDIYGESVGVSVIRGWGYPFTIYANETLFNRDSSYRLDISGAFASGYTTLDTPSHLVPAEVWANVTNGITALKGKSKPYYCSPVVAELGLNDTTGCLINNTKFTSSRLTGINFLGTYHVPLVKITFPKSASTAITVVSGIFYVVTGIVAIAIFFFRRDTVMLAASPVFLTMVLIGIALTFTSAIVWVSEPSSHICAARIWLPSIGFTLCMGAMIIKNVRLIVIFDAQMRKIRIRDSMLLLWISVLLTVDIILIGIWNSVGGISILPQQGVEGLGTYEVREICHTNRVGDKLLYAIISWHLAHLAVGCFVTFKIRVIDIEEFNESRPFGLSIYLVSLVTTICGILVGAGGTTNVQRVTIISLSFLIGAAAVLILLFAPKFLTIFLKGTRSLDTFLSTELGQKQKKGGNSASSTRATKSSGTSGSSGSGNNGNNKSSRETSAEDSADASETSSMPPPPLNKTVSVVVI